MLRSQGGLLKRVRGNFGLLVFFSTMGVLIVLWYVLCIIALPEYSDLLQPPVDWGTLLLMLVVVPFVSAPILSAVALVIVGLAQRKGCGFAVILLLGVAVPIAALIVVGISSAIAHALYIEPEQGQPGLQVTTPATSGRA